MKKSKEKPKRDKAPNTNPGLAPNALVQRGADRVSKMVGEQLKDVAAGRSDSSEEYGAEKLEQGVLRVADRSEQTIRDAGDKAKDVILRQLSKINAVSDKEIAEYVGRIIGGFPSEQLEDLQQSPHIYLAKIKKKIDALIDAHREKMFDLWVEQGKISCKPLYSLKSTISPIKAITTLPKTLYTAEEEMNGLEYDVAWEIANLPNIKWWHRNMSRSGFSINGYVNAFPDIIAMTESGKILMIEPKGDHLENAESRQKVKIGRIWEKLAGSNYRYYMVFRDKDLNVDGAVRFDRFMEIVKGM